MLEHCRETDVAAYGIKIPPFWPSDNMLCFAQVKPQFQLKGSVVQAVMFDYVLANLWQEIVTDVRDLLINPPEDNPYDAFKATLI